MPNLNNSVIELLATNNFGDTRYGSLAGPVGRFSAAALSSADATCASIWAFVTVVVGPFGPAAKAVLGSAALCAPVSTTTLSAATLSIFPTSPPCGS